MSEAKILIVSGPSGAGKGTLVKELIHKFPDLFISVSCTTRTIRKDLEQDGVHYHFITKDTFEDMLAHNGFAEYNEYCGNYYGTPKKPMDDALAAGRSVLLEIDPNGMKQVIKQYPDAVTIFIAPPSMETLRKRLTDRGESGEKLEKRLAQGQAEMQFRNEYTHIIINDVLETAVDEFLKCVASYIQK